MANKGLRAAARTLLAGLGLAMALPSVLAAGQDVKTLRDEIRQEQNRFDAIKTAHDGKTARYSSEVNQITSWIDEALILIGKEETAKVKVLSSKIRVYLDFVDASLERDAALTDAMESESKLKSLKAEHGKLEAYVQQLEAEEKVLQEKLDSMTKK